MWFGLILTLALAYGLSRILVSMEADEIMKNWKEYRCRPHVIMLAYMFKNKDDPRGDFQFTSDNFEFCASEIAKSVLNLALKPVMDVFYQMANAAIQSIGFTMNLRTLGGNLFNGLNRMFDIFTRRFNLTFHELHLSFLKQFSAIQKANAIATASVFSGITIIRGILNFFQLMITVVISILIIMVVLVIFLFFIFAPVIPLILVTISVVAATASAGAVSGMGDAFCFSEDTLILLKEDYKPIKQIVVGDILADGSTVTACMKFSADSSVELYEVDGIIVSGSHILYNLGSPIFVKDYKGATRFGGSVDSLYCLNTSSHKISVVGKHHVYEFADWEELDNTAMESWDSLVRLFLNGESSTFNNSDINESETGFSPECLARTMDGVVTVGSLENGAIVYDGVDWTEVIGTVMLDGSETRSMGKIGAEVLSGATWISEKGVWIRAIECSVWISEPPVKNLVSVFTKSGKIQIGDFVVRDFSDIGLEKINESYTFTLSRLIQKCSQ